MRFHGLSLFANVGIAETYLGEMGVEIRVANELEPERGRFYQHLYPQTKMIVGDITKDEVYQDIIAHSREEGVDFLLATPPCQGMSLAGKRDQEDPRNQLIYYAVKGILDLRPSYVLLENVPQQCQTLLYYRRKTMTIPEYLRKCLEPFYYFGKQSLVSAKDYGVPQIRKRNIILLTRRDMPYRWEMPPPLPEVQTLRQAIGAFPPLDPLLKEGLAETLAYFPQYLEKKAKGEALSPWHRPTTHRKRLVITMEHTPTGTSALENPVHFPKKSDGTPVKCHLNQYRRHSWDSPCRTITQNSGVISSLCCVHPGRLQENGLYSDPRCLSIYELMVVSSLPTDWAIPPWAKEKLIRSVIGEGIPPKMVQEIIRPLMDYYRAT